MGYCLAFMPPLASSPDFEDFIRYVRFQLCTTYKIPFKDDIWDKYTDEELIVEYYAHIYRNSKEDRERIEDELRGKDVDKLDDFASWAIAQEHKNLKELQEKAESMEDDVSFSPDSLGG